jgi:hypothetical protein
MLDPLQACCVERTSHMVSFSEHLHLTAPAQEGEAVVCLDHKEPAEGSVGQSNLTFNRKGL